MKRIIRNILAAILLAFSLLACSNDDYFHDSGTSNGYHDCTVWEYLKSNTENFSLVTEAIEKCNLVNVFDGTLYGDITFFGITDISVMQFLYKTFDTEKESFISDVPEELLKDMILSHVVLGKKMKESFDYEVKGTLTGGTEVETLTGATFRVYRTTSAYMGVPDIGPESLYIHALGSEHIVRVASSDLEMNNGVVHALSNTYEWAELK